MMRPVKENRGSAIIAAVIIGMVVMVFCLSALLISYTLFSSVNSSDEDFAVRELAYSSMETIDEEICGGEDRQEGLKSYIRSNIEAGSWNKGENRYFVLASPSGYEIKLILKYDMQEGELRLKSVVDIYEDEEKVFFLERDYVLAADGTEWRWEHEQK